MIAYELNRSLDICFKFAITYIDDEFVSSAKYLVEGNDLILLGEKESIRLSFTDKGIENDVSADEWDLSDGLIMVEEDSTESELLKYVYMVFRIWQQIPPYANPHMHEVLLKKLNEKLLYFDLRVSFDDEQFHIYHGTDTITIEQALSIIMERERGLKVMDQMEQTYKEAVRFKNLGQYERCMPLYLTIIGQEKKDSALFTKACYELGEVYYLEDDLERAAITYMRCDSSYVEDQNDLFLRIGHALLDNKLKSFSSQVKSYYRCTLSDTYKTQHEEEFEKAAASVAQMYEEYEKACIEVGRKKYKK
ncbi:MAG: hypothetical protein GX567_11765 [Clostridia bacterium]|nr:hypothetical protein [Clostridia bacterium]